MTEPDSAALREQILELTRRYHAAREAERQPSAGVPYAGRVYDERELVAAVGASLDFWLTLGPEGKAFEKALAKVIGVPHCLLTNSGSSANLVAVSGLTSPLLERPLRPGDEVITVAAGFPTTVNPILQVGCVPVYVDIDPATANIDVAYLEEARSDKTRAVVLAHTLGNPFDVDAVTAFCREHELFLMEDNCDALGSTYKGQPTGSFGDVGTSSFYPPHHITMGEGGAVYCRDGRLKRAIESFRDWGRDCWCPSGKDDTCGKRFGWQWELLPDGYDHKYVYSHVGYNLKPTDIQAAIGRAQLDKLPDFVAARRRNWQALRDALQPFSDRWRIIEATPHSEPSWFALMLVMREPNHDTLTRVCRELEAAGIGNRRLFAGNILWQPAYKDTPRRVIGELPVTEAVARGGVFVGVYPGLSEAQRARQLEVLTDVLGKA